MMTSHRHSSHIDTIAGIHSRTLIPGPTTAVFANRARDQSGAVPSISTIATYPASLIALIPDPWTPIDLLQVSQPWIRDQFWLLVRL